jgi:hypothetical protein
MVYIGVDLHRKKSQVAVVNEAGEVLANRAVATEGIEIIRRPAPGRRRGGAHVAPR